MYNKKELREKAVDGYKYSGFWDGLHHYIKEVREGHHLVGYMDCAVSDDDIADGKISSIKLYYMDEDKDNKVSHEEWEDWKDTTRK